MKINLLVISLFITTMLNAQIKKGALFLGGDIQIYGTEYKSTDSNQYTRNTINYNFSPSVGWVVKNNVVIGGRLLLTFSSDKEMHPNDYHSKGNQIGGAVWARKYLPLGKSFFLFGDLSLSGQSVYMRSDYIVPFGYHKEKGFSINAGLYPGVSYQIDKCLFIETALNNLISLGYERKNTEQGSQASPIKSVLKSYILASSLGSGVPLQIGIRWIISRRSNA